MIKQLPLDSETQNGFRLQLQDYHLLNHTGFLNKDSLPLGQMSVHGLHVLIPFSSTSILGLGQARTHELISTTKLSKRDRGGNNEKKWQIMNVPTSISKETELVKRQDLYLY